MGVAEQIRAALVQEFSSSEVEVRDDSEAHRGHSGYQEGGESHFHVVIAADALAPLSRIARHRAIHSAIGPELIGRIHALSIEIK